MKKRTKGNKRWFAAIFMVALALMLVGCGTANTNGTALANGGTLLLRVNPDIEIDYDGNGLVTAVSGTNDEGRAIVSNYTGYYGRPCGDVVDALASLGREVEDGLFIIMSAACRAAIRRDSDFIAAHSGEIVYTGQFGTLCGVPVLFSALVPDGMTIITDRNAVKFFVKREASLEQDRDIETKINTVVYERCGLIALVDDTSTVILGKKAADITASVSSGTLTVSGKKTSSDDIYWRKADFAALGGEDVSSWNKWDGSSKLDTAAGERISVAEAGTDGLCVASAVVTAA